MVKIKTIFLFNSLFKICPDRDLKFFNYYLKKKLYSHLIPSSPHNPVAYWSSSARNWIRVTAAAMPHPLTIYSGLGIKPMSPQPQQLVLTCCTAAGPPKCYSCFWRPSFWCHEFSITVWIFYFFFFDLLWF